MREVEAKYTDALSMGRKLLSELRDEKGLLLQPGVEKHWSEHSERATLPSLVSALAVFPADWIDHLGRWSARVSDGYIRNQRQRIHAMQDAVAAAFEQAADPSHLFGERDIMEGVREAMKSLGYDDEDIMYQVTRLAAKPAPGPKAARPAPARTDDDPAGVFDAEPAEGDPESPTERASSTPASPNKDDIDMHEFEAPENVVDSHPPEDLTETKLEDELPPVLPLPSRHVVSVLDAEIALGDFLIATRARSRFRTLHRKGSCFREPGRDYHEYRVVGPILPDSTMYDAACRSCFARDAPLAERPEAEEDSASTGSSSD